MKITLTMVDSLATYMELPTLPTAASTVNFLDLTLKLAVDSLVTSQAAIPST